jgi:hypothetical protein
VVQGANDPRVNRREAEQIVIALRDRGFPVEYMLAPDEGHGFQRPVNSMSMFMAAEKFLAKYLDGRYQEGATPEVTRRLAELMVDPKTVTVSKKVDATDTMSTPMGDVTDVAILEKGSLALRKRTVKQGPANIDVDFAGGKATGKMSINGQDKAISADLGGELFADAAGSRQVIGCLPLAEGYSTTFRNFDLQKQKTKLLELKVSGAETVAVPAGTFETLRVELSSADGGNDQMTIWIAKDTRQAVKFSAVMGSMGGAKMTAELTQ